MPNAKISRRGVALTTAILGMMVALLVPSAAAAVSAPFATVSRYMSTLNTTTLYNEGCAQGTAAQQTFVAQNLVVVLDFGGPVAFGNGVYGAKLFNGTTATTSTIRDAVEWYAIGFHVCSAIDNSDHLRLAIGTNNSTGAAVGNAAGAAWGQMINDLNIWASVNPEGQTVSFAGANDIEPGFGDPIPARAWVTGFDTATNWSMYNYGSADGCSSIQIPGSDCGTTAHPTWSAEDIYYVSWGAQPCEPLPEVYLYPPPGNALQAKQWYWLSKYSIANHGSRFVFAGSMTEHASDSTTNTAVQGWSELYNQVNSDTTTAGSVKWSTDVTHAN
jgi:hypothetical protein